jgi:hypothetical protein
VPSRLTNLLILAVVLGLAGSGLVGWAMPDRWAQPLYGLHRALGVLLLVLLASKADIVRKSLRRRLGRARPDRSVALGATAGLGSLGSMAFGLAWVFNLVSFDSLWGYSPLNLHVYLGLGLLPLMLLHLCQRWERRPRVGDLLTRRSALQLMWLSAGALVGWRLLEDGTAARTVNGSRRPSGSKHAGSFSGNAFPTTIWLLDGVPSIDPASWRLELAGRLDQPGLVSYAELLSPPLREMRAVLDCTGGWWSEQYWQGVPLGVLLADRGIRPGATAVAVVSITGHRWWFPLDEVRGMLLGTHVGGEPLAPAHGYPVRLVAPGRRGFQWVKWVGRIDVV